MAEQGKRRGRWFGVALFAVIAAILGGIYAWLTFTGPLEHASLGTLVQDLKRARTESKGSLNVYAYRMHHFLREAVVGQPWRDAIEQLLKQGAVIKGSAPGFATMVLPDNGFTFPRGGKLEATIYLDRERAPMVSRPMTLKVKAVRFDLALVDPLSLKDPATAFPPGSVLAEHFKRTAVLGTLKRLPRVTGLSLNYIADSASHLAGGMNVRMELSPPPGRNDVSASIATSWTSDLESNRKRFISWLPLYFGSGRDDITFNGSSNEMGGTEPRRSYTLRRKDGKGYEPYTPDPEAITDDDLRSLPADSKGLSLSYAPVKTLTQLSRFQGLTRLECGAPVDETGLQTIAALPELLKLFVSFSSPRGISILSKSTSLQELNLQGSINSKDEISALATMKSLKMLRLYQRTPYDPELIPTLASLPNLETLWLTNANVGTTAELKAISKASKLKDLFIKVTGLPSGDLLSLKELSLEKLLMTDAELNDQTIQAIASIKSLRVLRLTNAKGLSGDRILAFAKLPNLQAITFYRCPGVTDAALQKLKAKLGPDFIEELPE